VKHRALRGKVVAVDGRKKRSEKKGRGFLTVQYRSAGRHGDPGRGRLRKRRSSFRGYKLGESWGGGNDGILTAMPSGALESADGKKLKKRNRRFKNKRCLWKGAFRRK